MNVDPQPCLAEHNYLPYHFRLVLKRVKIRRKFLDAILHQEPDPEPGANRKGPAPQYASADHCCGAGLFLTGYGYFFAGSGSSSYKSRLSTKKLFFEQHPIFLTRKNSLTFKINKHLINFGTNGENIIQNFFWIARPGFESRPDASPQCDLRGGRYLWNIVKYLTFKNPRPPWAVNLKEGISSVLYKVEPEPDLHTGSATRSQSYCQAC